METGEVPAGERTILVDLSRIGACLASYSPELRKKAVDAIRAVHTRVRAQIVYASPDTSLLQIEQEGIFEVYYEAFADRLDILDINIDETPLADKRGAFVVRRHGTVRAIRIQGPDIGPSASLSLVGGVGEYRGVSRGEWRSGGPETVLIDWKDAWNSIMADTTTGVFITGATGSGKTSGSGRLLARAYIRAGMGGLVLCAKAEERAQWQELARSVCRENDLVIFDTKGERRFDPLEWEAGRAREGDDQVINTVLLLDELAVVAVRARSAHHGAGGGDRAFFQDALHLMLAALVALAVASGEPVTLPRLCELVSSAPRSIAELHAKEWQDKSPLVRLLARLAAGETTSRHRAARGLSKWIFIYWTGEYPRLSDRTRGIIDMMFSTAVQRFLYSRLRQLFTGGSTISPKACFDGKIILADSPAQGLYVAGSRAALVWKYCFRIAVMHRSDSRCKLRSVFLRANEVQNFITRSNTEYQAVARSAGCCTAYLAQQRESFSEFVGERATENLLTNVQTKSFCQNTGATNELATWFVGELTNSNWGDLQHLADRSVPGWP